MADLCAGHLKRSLSDSKRTRTVDEILARLKKHRNKFSHIAVQGYSTAILGGIIADRLNKDIVIVRKPREKCYSEHSVEQTGRIDKYIIIDDLICTGATCSRIIQKLGVADCYGILTYLEDDSQGEMFYRINNSLSKANQIPESVWSNIQTF